MSTPAKKVPAKTPSKSATSSSTANPLKKPATKAKAPSLNLADLDTTEKEAVPAKILPEDIKIQEEDDFIDDNNNEELDDEDSGKDQVEDNLAPTALIDRLSKENTGTLVSETKIQETVTEVAVTVVVPSSLNQQFEIPPCVDTEDSNHNPSGIKLIVEAYAPGCLDCSHLVPTGANEYSDCHYSNGNTFCPAQSIKILFTGRRNVFLNKLKSARATGDSNRVLKILATLEKEPIELKDYVLSKSGII